MLRKIQIFVNTVALTALLATVATADDLQLSPGHPESYTVQKGDTLWDISGHFLTQPWRWPEIWHANPQVKNPDLIYPGDVLTLVYVNGHPELELSTGDRHLGARLYKRSPSVREYAHDDSIKPIPLDAIGPFLRQPLVVSDGEMEKLPYIVSSEDQHLANGSGINVYIRGLPVDAKVSRYTVFRKGDAYRSPGAKKGDILGYEALDVGDVVITRSGDPAVGKVVRVSREILNGDRLIPASNELLPEFVPHAPSEPVNGHIVDVIDGLDMFGPRQVIVLDVGKNQGIEPGHVLALQVSSLTVLDQTRTDLKQKEEDEKRLKFQRSDKSPVDSLMEHVANDVRDTKRALDRKLGVQFNTAPEEVALPAERAGEAMVFRVFDHVSYALVMNLSRPVRVEDSVTNP